MTVDLLVFGPHPDDLEIGAAGSIALHVADGHRVGLCDLTEGELSTNGTVEERRAEADAAREVLGAAWRENLRLPDGGVADSPDQVRAVAEMIRRARPHAILAPYWEDRHPDHLGASRLVTRAAFASGLRRYDAVGEPWRPDWVCYYFINDAGPISFAIDVSAHYETKRRALTCYRSQFTRAGGAAATRLTSPLFMQLVESRDAQFGALAAVQFAEGFVVRDPILRPHLFRHQTFGMR